MKPLPNESDAQYVERLLTDLALVKAELEIALSVSSSRAATCNHLRTELEETSARLEASRSDVDHYKAKAELLDGEVERLRAALETAYQEMPRALFKARNDIRTALSEGKDNG